MKTTTTFVTTNTPEIVIVFSEKALNLSSTCFHRDFTQKIILVAYGPFK
jgi:hypothetical protein